MNIILSTLNNFLRVFLFWQKASDKMIGTATAIASSPAVWAICCILLVGFILKKVYEKER